jgi:hypothetical protein
MATDVLVRFDETDAEDVFRQLIKSGIRFGRKGDVAEALVVAPSMDLLKRLNYAIKSEMFEKVSGYIKYLIFELNYSVEINNNSNSDNYGELYVGDGCAYDKYLSSRKKEE